MMSEDCFDVRFDPDAEEEYNRLDGSVLGAVNKAIDELVLRADEVGKALRNNNDTKLAGCREIKLRDAGIRIVYRVTDQVVHVLRIVIVLTIERRNRDMAFKIAHSRMKAIRKLTKEESRKLHEKQKRWQDMIRTKRPKQGE
ncbi:type II toxin-antitoxin system RelE family toxin [Cohnella hongkongensis]|uniref:Type II toxin-antitoxin system RelE/ParE family toxin n=1 Tax=Cohnella hongkongensis TaxID=178337 RepID=A0ABV9FFK8_9BACL